MKRPFLIILVFAGVFICGGVVGGAISIHYYERFVRERASDRFLGREMKELGEKLELTAQQKKEIRTLFLRSMDDQRSARKQMDVIMERMIGNIEKVLTPEQLAKFREHRAQQRALRERRGPPGGPGGSFGERRERPPAAGASRPEGAQPASSPGTSPEPTPPPPDLPRPPAP